MFSLLKAKRLSLILATFGIIILGISFSFFTKSQGQLPPTPNAIQPSQQVIKGESTISSKPAESVDNLQIVRVIKVIDGDTIEIDGGQRVRYIGIDTPETVHPSKPVQCFGREASYKNHELVDGKNIQMEKDVSETDKYGRLLRYIYLDDPSTDSGKVIFVNDYLVREGYAHSSSYPPDIKYQTQFSEAEREAREALRGLWGGCSGSNNQGAATSGCLIKGNISSNGEKIYHMPGQKYYEKTVIDESKSERWFCSEDEAVSAGFRKSKI